MMEPTVSVVIPCYNAQPYIDVAIESAFRQTHRPAEIIVVDDGSTDQSARIVESFISTVPMLRLIRQANAGPSRARNTAIQASTSDLVALLDADDVWLPTKLAAQAAAMPCRSNLVLTFCGHEVDTRKNRVV